MLGNGYYVRPVELDCHFDSICESCTFFVTTIEFRPTLQAQRDHTASTGRGSPQPADLRQLIRRLPSPTATIGLGQHDPLPQRLEPDPQLQAQSCAAAYGGRRSPRRSRAVRAARSR